LKTSPRFSTFLDRKRNEAELDALIANWSSNHVAEELEASLQKAGIIASVVNSVKDLVSEDSQLKYRGYFRRFKQSVIGEHIYRGPAFRLSRNKDTQFAGPTLGEHNDYVCKELLGLSDEEIAEAIIQGGITTDTDLPPDMASTF
jgi:crotonobetainyl-CoA:carnitine CoA-transferase CaiB-like acyl-CoA transferase